MASKVAQVLSASATAIGSGKRPTLYVTNLAWTVGNKELRTYFNNFGEVTRVNVIFDKNTGLSKGFGFVSFKSEEATQSVFQKLNHSLEGRKIDIKHSDN